ncbi:hypothetical protein ABPG77_009543 [Micractinium sp. CCAP 211/92]
MRCFDRFVTFLNTAAWCYSAEKGDAARPGNPLPAVPRAAPAAFVSPRHRHTGMGKRGADGGAGGKPSKKRYLNKAPPSGSKSGIPLQTRGVLLSCTTGREQQAGREAASLLTEFYERLGGTWKQQAAGAAADEAAATDGADAPSDIAAALASEVAELKQGARQPFYYHLIGVNSVVYLEYKDAEGPSPSAIVLAACEAVAAGREARTRFCQRLCPVEATSFASLEKIQEMAARVVAEHFPTGADAPIEFAVQYDARATPPGLERMQVIDAFATQVPAPHKVNLGAPQKTILVSITKATCGVAVVDRFKELFRYNIATLSLPEEEREAQREAQRAQSKEQQKVQAEQKAAAAQGKDDATEERQGEAAAAAVDAPEPDASVVQKD